MSGTVKKIFTVLIIIIVMLLIAGLVINTLLPNMALTIVNAIEDTAYKASGLDFDWNGDGNGGGDTDDSYQGDESDDDIDGETVEGF